MTSLPRRSVWVDAQGAQNALHPERGLARHVVELSRTLLDLAPEAIGGVGLNPAMAVPPGLEFVVEKGHAIAPVSNAGPPKSRPAIYHLPSPFELLSLDVLWPDWAREPEIRTVVTVHDLIPLIFRGHYLDPHPFSAAFYLGRTALVRTADRVLAISESTAADTAELLGVDENRISVIDSGVTSDLAPVMRTESEAWTLLGTSLPAVRSGFLLYVGGDEWRKNLEGLIAAYAQLPAGLRRAHQLVIVCSIREERKRELAAFAEQQGAEADSVVLTGYVPDTELAALYRACHLFVFPSLYEGAGLPVLEAMSCGAPVAASRSSSIPEILGDLEATFEPTDPADIARCLEQALSTPELLESLRERSRRRAAIFTWERVARLTLEGYEQALQVRRGPAARRRPRVAILGPWPPVPAATLSEGVINRLGARVDVELFSPSVPGIDGSPAGVSLRRADEFEWRHGLEGFDRLIYVLGASDPEARFHALDALMRRPGVVIVDDEPLAELFRAYYRERFDGDELWLAETYDRYGETVTGVTADRGKDPEAGFGEFMSGLLSARAERLVTGGARGVLESLL